MKYVDDVIVGAPSTITRELIDAIEPYLVVHGPSSPSPTTSEDPYRIPKQLGIFQQVDSDYPNFTSRDVIRRVLSNYQMYSMRNQRKEQAPTEVRFS
jgi:ethanolamine-phosphate cytidylyltransferase